MKSKKKETKKFFNYQNNFFIFITISFLFLIIGYASISPVLMEISGIASAEKELDSGVYISNVSILSNADADISVSNPTYSKKFFQDIVALSDTNKLSEITYKITIYNGSKQDVLFDEVYHEAIPEMLLNDNEDIYIEVEDIGSIIESNTYKDFNVTIKYREGLDTITDNTVNVGLNFKFKEILYITYAGFDNVINYPITTLEGDDLTITFENDIDYINLFKNTKPLANNRDFSFNNHTLTYHVNSGGNLEISAENNHPIESNFPVIDIVPNTPFLFTGNDFYTYNADLRTIYFEANLSKITTLDSKDNIISIGTEINTFTPTQANGINLHFFYSDANGRMIISPVMKSANGHMQFTTVVDNSNNLLKCAINSNGLYCNGNKLISSEGIQTSLVNKFSNYTTLTENEYLHEFFTQISNDNQVKIGSLEGDNRSNAIYNDVIIFDKKLTDTEMINITKIKEEIRSDFNTTNLLNPNNPIVKNQPFKLFENQNFNVLSQTLLVEMDVSGVIYNNENILSLGKNIADWFPVTYGDTHLHFFYSPNKNIIAAPLTKGQSVRQYSKTLTLIDDKYIKIAFSSNGVYINGEKIFDKYSIGSNVTCINGAGNDSYYLGKFFDPWVAGNYNIDIGSTQGSARSNAEYLKFEIYDISMTPNELIHYTQTHDQ